jgi:hypothetical protein
MPAKLTLILPKLCTNQMVTNPLTNEIQSHDTNLSLILRHAVMCENIRCSIMHCSKGKQLWDHVKECKDNDTCNFNNICSYAKMVLVHYAQSTNKFNCSTCCWLKINNPNNVSDKKINKNKLNKLAVKSIKSIKSVKLTTNEDKKMPVNEKETKMWHLLLLKHTIKCKRICNSNNCMKMKSLIQHKIECNATLCIKCYRVSNLYKLHYNLCSDEKCPISPCQKKVIG